MQQKVQLLLELGKPRILLLMCLLTLSGSALSPNFLSPNFPPTRLGATLLFRWMAITFPTAFSPQMWSLAHALGAALVVGLLWLGIALINDLSDSAIDRISNPERPVPSRRIRPSEVLRWALGAQAVAFGLILLHGSRPSLLLALAGATLGNAYSLPPFRLRRSGIAATLLIGGGVAMALVGGSLAQFQLTQVGSLSAVALGLLAAAVSMVKDFKDIDGDRAAGVKTLPVLLGIRGAVLINMIIVSAAYLLALYLLVQRIGMRTPVIGAFTIMALINLWILDQFLHDPGPMYALRAYRLATMIFLGVTLLYVGAQIVY